ncbi:ribokinase [soil metagenome]
MTGRSEGGRVLVVGSSNTDLVCQTDRLPLAGETVASRSFAIYPGGKAANQAVAAARSGSTVSFVGCFGDDDYGRERYRELAEEGVDLAGSRVIEGETSGLALIAVDPSGENLIITVGGANDRTSVSQLESALQRGAYDVVLLPNEAPPDVVRRAVTSGPESTIVLNAAPYARHLSEIAGMIDVLVCNEVEAAQFLGREVGVANADQAVTELAELARGTAVITLGAAGAVGCQGGRVLQAPAPKIDVVDMTGAGDAFCGTFATWLAAGRSFEDAVNAGTVAGSLAATRAGAQPSLPEYAEIAARL